MVVERTGLPLECSALSASPLSSHCPQCLPPPGRYVYVCVWGRRNREGREGEGREGREKGGRREGREEGGKGGTRERRREEGGGRREEGRRGEIERKPRHTVIVLHIKLTYI